ncbi:MAG: ATP-binding protein [Verrucomicrobiota bacterium]|nr:ATP-binding protein [Verrucomicrobiota bacterium]
MKFTPDGGSITLRTWNDETGRCVIAISDTGIGIEADHQARIFNAFEQDERTITRRFGGLGLGLAISKTLVELHGGTIAVEARGADAAPPSAYSGCAGRSGDRVEEICEWQRRVPASLQVLIVDDHAETLPVLFTLLSKRGYKVAAAVSFQRALEILEGERFDVLGAVRCSISDIGLPDGDGKDLIRAAKHRQALKGIALSGFGMEDDRRNSRESGFDYHLTKPIEFQELESVLREIAS